MRALRYPPLHRPDHFSRLGESIDGFLGEDLVSVQMDFEHPSSAFDETRGNVEALFNLVRQTGGAWLVVSLHAIFDGDFMSHGIASFRRWNDEYTGR